MTPAVAGHLDVLLQGMLHPLLILTPEGSVQEANRAALEFLDARRGDVLDRPLWELAPWNASASLRADLQRAVRDAASGKPTKQSFEAGGYAFSFNAVAGSIVIEGREMEDREVKAPSEPTRQDWDKIKFAFAAARMAAWSWDVATDTFSSHPFLDRLFGLPAATNVSGDEFIAGLWIEDRPRIREALENAVASRTGLRVEFRASAPDGTAKWLLGAGAVHCDEVGTPVRIDGITIDITERKETELRLRESDARFRALFEHAGIGIAMVNHDGVLMESNPALERLLGYSAGELRHMAFPQFTHEDDVELDWRLYQELMSGARDRYEVEKRYWRKNGQLIWARLVVSLVRDAEGKPLFGIGMAQDITQRHLVEQEIQSLSEKLITTQEQERTRIARELHDDLAQQLAALSISVSNLKRTIPADAQELRAQADRLHQRLAGAAESVRRLSHELHPAILEHSGIAAALESYCTQFSLLNHIEVALGAAGRFEDVSPAVALCLYRVAQEALQNVARHSGAKRAEVGLHRAHGQVHLEISDAGCGFEAARSAPREGLGLVSMKERARLLQGALHIESALGKGTRLRVSIPL